MSSSRRFINHLVIRTENGRQIVLSTEFETDSSLCNKARELLGTCWNGSKVRSAGTFISVIRGREDNA